MQKQKVAIQGFKGAFHQEAAEKYFKSEIELVECLTFQQVAQAVDSGRANKGIVAIENSLAGSILPNYAIIRDSELQIEGEVYLRINQHLLALPGQSVEDIREIHSHPMAIAQCEGFLHSLKHVKVVATDDTALSARHISENKLKTTAAIAGKRAAIEYGLAVLAESIETNPNNYTRFVIISKPGNINPALNANKASIAIALPHRVGSLQLALQAIARYGVNLTMLQSLPQVGSPWEYYFHADVVFRHEDDFGLAMEALNKHCTYVKVFGIYREANQN